MTESVSESENPAIPSPTSEVPRPRTNHDWWPNQLDLSVLHRHSPLSDPMGEDFDYAEEFATLDVEALKRDLIELMTTSQDWWPADYGHYGPLFIRMSWHAAGTYRIADGRGGGGKGAQRFAPLNSWPDNAKPRQGAPAAVADQAEVRPQDLVGRPARLRRQRRDGVDGLQTFGFGFGREDIWEPEEIFWGSEDTWLGDERYSGDRELAKPLGAVQMGLIYVNPEGPNGNPDPLAAARGHPRDLRPHGDERRGDRRADRRRAHVRQDPRRGRPRHGRPEPEAAPLEQQGLGWKNSFGSGNGKATTLTSGLEGAWTSEPTKWDNGFLENLFGYEWELTESPAGAKQWTPKNPEADDTVPDAHDPSKRPAPMMLTTDLALRFDPVYEPIARRFYENPDQLADAFAKAWYKLLHRDMGPVSRYLGPWVPEPQLWQDPVPAVDHELIGDADVAALKEKVLASGLSISRLVSTAWASASSFRGTDKRGGANGARIRLAPQKDWAANEPAELAGGAADARADPAGVQRLAAGGKQVSLADLIVLGGCAAVEQAAKNAGHDVTVPFTPGRTDASQEQTDVEAFAVLEPTADGFRNYFRPGEPLPLEHGLLDRAYMLTLTAPEMTVLIGGLRALDANFGQSQHGVFTDRPETLTNDFFVNLLDMGTEWKASASDENVYEGRDRGTGEVKWTGSRVDLVFGSNSSCVPSRRSTRATTRRRSSCATSSPRGTRS